MPNQFPKSKRKEFLFKNTIQAKLGMVDLDYDAAGSSQRWVCPNDRHLTLRSKISTGWCMKSYEFTHYNSKLTPLDEDELRQIKEIMRRQEEMEEKEKERIGKLVEQINRLRDSALGNGSTTCILCGELFGTIPFFGLKSYVCRQCKKKVCDKCGVQVTGPVNMMMVCKICYETKELYKKSGAWLTQTLPPYKLPPSPSRPTSRRHRANTGVTLDLPIWASQGKSHSYQSIPTAPGLESLAEKQANSRRNYDEKYPYESTSCSSISTSRTSLKKSKKSSPSSYSFSNAGPANYGKKASGST